MSEHLGLGSPGSTGLWLCVLIAGVGCASSPRAPRRPRAELCSFDGYLAQLCRENDGRDRDGDGLPDALESLLGTDPDRADSDADGRPDAEDPCPLLEGEEPRGVEAEIRQAAVSHLLREHDHVIVAIPDGEEPICYRGVPGVQLHGRDVPWEYASLRFFRVSQGPGSAPSDLPTAVVEARFGGASSGCLWRMTLVRRRGRWRVLDAIPTLCA